MRKLLYLQFVEEWGATATLFTIRSEMVCKRCDIYSEEWNKGQQFRG